MIDVIEQNLFSLSPKAFRLLLKDKTTNQNLCWATDYYLHLGDGYHPKDYITEDLIIGENTKVIQPRILKSQEQKNWRTKNKAEVFTPSWICNKQNNLIDEAWFGKKDVFNITNGEQWSSTKEKITFKNKEKGSKRFLEWQKYVDLKRLEITCGEAPYLVSRYDTVTGIEIPVNERIGLLDRKLRIVNENTQSEEDWLKWTIRAFQASYGYDFQGDNVLIARENLLYTFIDYYQLRFSKEPKVEYINTIANILSWNIWQMDGIKLIVPYSDILKNSNEENIEDFFDRTVSENDLNNGSPIYSVIMDWRENHCIEFREVLNGGRNYGRK